MQRRLWMLTGLSAMVILAAFFLPPITQPSDYHQFADQRIFFSIPDFFNVISNLAIFISGLTGLWFLVRLSRSSVRNQVFIETAECWPYWILFLSVVMAGVGSIYYHWSPDNDGLVWDRIPIALGIMALLSAVLTERIGAQVGMWSLPFLTVLGVASVVYWYWTERVGVGSLNFYVVSQFYSILLILLLSMLFPSRYTRGTDIYQVVALYAVAKLTEVLDAEIYSWGQIISGHTIKHLLVALAVYWIVRTLQKRRPLQERI
ncbi:MAG: alkaline phytoceramidase [Pseudomonadota bacterium]